MEWLKGLIESLEVTTFLRVDDTPDHANFWYDKNSNFTDKLREVVRKQPVEIPRWRLVKPGEYTIVYDREFLRTGLEDLPENHRLFRKN